MFLSMPPFALPSVWLHPKWHIVWKIVFTAAVAGSCWISYFAIHGLIQYVDEMARMFDKI